MSGTVSVDVTDGSTWAADGPLQEILTAFNDHKPLAIANGVRSLVTDGFTISGTAPFMRSATAEITATVMKNGDITLLVNLPSVELSHLLGASADLRVPAGFDLTMPMTTVLIKRSGSTLSLTAATVIAGVGEVVFVAGYAGKWQVAVGFQLGVAKLAALPAPLGSKLRAFDKFVGLNDVMMVLSSYDDADFDFPEASSFQAPSIGLGKIALPKQSAGKLVQGLNIYAGLDTTNAAAFRAIAKFLKLKLDGSVAVTLAVSLPDPASNTKLFLSVQEQIAPSVALTAELGFLLAGGEVGAFLTGEAVAAIQGQPVQFDVTALVVENGALFSGSMTNPTPIPFKIGGMSFHLADVGLVIGVDDEGIPSFGFGANIDIGKFNAAVALFVDSTDPAKSMFTAAVSELSLLDVVEVLANQKSALDPALKDVLSTFALQPLAAFQLLPGVAHALDNRDLKSIAAAFASHGIALPADSGQVLLDVVTPGHLWYVTDMKAMNHYTLTFTNNAVAVSLEPQLYVAPQATSIGALSFPPGYKVIAELDILQQRPMIDIEIAGRSGITAEVDLGPIIVHSPNFLAITDAGGVGGPYLSLATYARPQETDPQFRQPHFAMSGSVHLLGAEVAGVSMNFSKAGVIFELKGQISPVVHIDLNANIQSLTNLGLGGAIVIGVNDWLDLGPLGKVLVRADANGSLNVAVRNGTAFATFQASLQFESQQLATPVLELDVNARALPGIAQRLVSELQKVLSDQLLKNASRFVDLAKRGLLQGVGSAEQIARVLHANFNLGGTDVGNLLRQAGYNDLKISQAVSAEFKTAVSTVVPVLNSTIGVVSGTATTVVTTVTQAPAQVEKTLGNAFDSLKHLLG